MILGEAAAIFAGGAAAGLINAVAGGGTLLSFPVLLWLGRDPIMANATNAIALFPGSLASAFAFRRELAGSRRLMALVLPPSIAGGILGAALLLLTPSRLFSSLIPYLILLATLLIALKRPLARMAGGRAPPEPASVPASAAAPPLPGGAGLVFGQLLVGVYGGYFGAAMGIMMLAAYGLAGINDVHQRNGLKNVAATLINALAGVVFALSGAVIWADAALLAAGAVVGGYVGASVGRRLNARALEILIVVIGLGVTALHLARSR